MVAPRLPWSAAEVRSGTITVPIGGKGANDAEGRTFRARDFVAS